MALTEKEKHLFFPFLKKFYEHIIVVCGDAL
jgi:hypothetical protein